MALDLSKDKFNELKLHKGHHIVCAGHRDMDIVFECATCGCTLLYYKNPEKICKCGYDPCHPQEHAGWQPE